MSFALLKIILSGILIAFASWLAGKKPILAGFIIALPLMSMLSILFSYWEHKDMVRINQFAVSILVAVPLSMPFFIPFLLNKWFRLNFALTFCLAIGFVALAYALHSLVFKSGVFSFKG
jgi:hypothetical protein